MRYELRWSNGYWKLFDTRNYCGVDTFGLREHGLEAVLSANETGRWRISNSAERD